MRYLDFNYKYNTEIEALNEPYDNNENGTISETENNERPTFMSIGVTR